MSEMTNEQDINCTQHHRFGRFFNREDFNRLSTVREDSIEINSVFNDNKNENSLDISEEEDEDKSFLSLGDYDIIEMPEDDDDNNHHHRLQQEHVLNETSLSVMTTADLLRERIAFITGGATHNCPIITFPDNPNIDISQEKYKKVITYLTQVPSENERQLGFVIVVDRRSDKWTSVKTIINYIEDYFPYSIHVIYLLRPNGIFQRALSKLTFNETTCSHKVIVCRSLAELHDYLDSSQLSKDLGGQIDFRLFEWIEQRAAIEKLTKAIYDLNSSLSTFIRESEECEFPNDVDGTKLIIAKHSSEKQDLEQELDNTKCYGESLLRIIQHSQDSSTSSILAPDKVAHSKGVCNALMHIENSDKVLKEFWSVHQPRLLRCFELRRFETRFKEIQGLFTQLLDDLSILPNSDRSIVEIDNILTQLDILTDRAQSVMEQATSLRNDGLNLITKQQSYGLDSIEPKCQELETIKLKLNEQIQEKRQNLLLLRSYNDKLELVNYWCSKGKDMLNMHQIHLSNEKAAKSLNELEDFLKELKSINIDDLQNSNIPEPLRVGSMIRQVLSRVNDVMDLCEKRCEQLRKLAQPINRPVQRVQPLTLETSLSLNLISSLSANSTDTESIECINMKIDRKQRHVVRELLVTEQVYVDELKTIIEKSNFKLYEQYCQNKPNSEKIWENYCSSHPFFLKIQQSLGHRLPLDSYLLKPIQRITQYQLLLKEMIKYTRDENDKNRLQDALSVMLNILANLNNVMHTMLISGYPGNLNSLGKILLRGEHFQILKEKRRSSTSYLRTKTCVRDIFLYDKEILFCKKKNDGHSRSVYQFKESIKVSDVSLSTHYKGDRRKFELILKDWSYVIQPSVDDDSTRWIETVKKLVSHQIEQKRAEMKTRSASLDHGSHLRRQTHVRQMESDDENMHDHSISDESDSELPTKHYYSRKNSSSGGSSSNASSTGSAKLYSKLTTSKSNSTSL
ncbi:unnamed protein product [Didymodactylos carnosus]|uniref:Guanine nucleotide exchange factor DBS-like n=1 Tax=Didymodactylos carnosus TaxID=1234261 RepID=A0A813REB4_9BILA|nr:unnamed protein product [Didymodactylos carnosus]CAF0779096.1 unnamed protein product [Didymodactylos carnosus]CAF3494104.1 unnamed protein product [Didymodactylos carnosus]CAF3562052.1 unnamed protein product [Didymodactylos carnosus]